MGRIAEKLEAADEGDGDKNASATSSPLTVFLDGAYTLYRPEYLNRHLDVVVSLAWQSDDSRYNIKGS